MTNKELEKVINASILEVETAINIVNNLTESEDDEFVDEYIKSALTSNTADAKLFRQAVANSAVKELTDFIDKTKKEINKMRRYYEFNKAD